MFTSDAVGAASLGLPVSEASFLVDPLATPFSVFLASAAAAKSLLVSFWSLSSKLPTCWLFSTEMSHGMESCGLGVGK